MNVPTNHQNGSTHLSAERADHREWIGGRVITLLSHYWREDDPTELTAAIGADWADVLEGFPQHILQKACIRYQRENPRRKPTPGAIYDLAMKLMPKPQIVRCNVEERKEPVVTKEAATAIMEEYGFKPKTFGGAA